MERCKQFKMSCVLCNSLNNLKKFVEQYQNILSKAFKYNFPEFHDCKICIECSNEIMLIDKFKKKLDEASKNIFKNGFNSEKKDLKGILQNNFSDLNIGETMMLGDITIKKVKTKQFTNEDNNNIIIIDLDELTQNTNNENSTGNGGNFYVRPLTEGARNKIKQILKLKKRFSDVDNTQNNLWKYIHTQIGNPEHDNEVFLQDIKNISNEDLSKIFCVDSQEIDDALPRKKIQSENRIKKYPPIEKNCTQCPVCNRKYKLHRQLLPHYRKHFRMFPCYVCGNTFSSSGELLQHLKMHDSAVYPCQFCSKKYKSKNMVLHHVKRCHNKIKPYNCSICKIRFNYLVSRRRHAYEVHGIKIFNYPCKECDKLFFRLPDLNRHTKLVHSHQKDHICMLCDKAFSTAKYLQHHMVTHTGIKDFHCERCGKSFPRLNSLKEHLKIHLNLRQHQCHICQKRFIQKITLKLHMKTHGFNTS